MKRTHLALPLGIALAALPAAAQTDMSTSHNASNPSRASASSSLARADRNFLTEAAGGGLAEVELGKLAVEKGSRPEVKAFGQQMVDDHSKANEDLKKVAESKGVAVPDTLPAKEASLKNKLSALSGDAFDKAYVNAMLKDHKHDVAVFEKQSTDAKDADVQAFASRTLPTLKAHLSHVEGLSKAVKRPMNDTSASRGM